MPRIRRSRASRPENDSTAEVSIPDKLYFRIGEVSKLAQTRPYVLRYWESEFPTLRPGKSRSGHRLYRREDVAMVLKIRHLLYQKGFTIEGARRELADNTPESGEPKQPSSPVIDGTQLKSIKRELQNILTILSRR